MNLPNNAPLQEVSDSILKDKSIRLYIKREDMIHPNISGNKWRKLYYNMREAQRSNKTTLVTFEVRIQIILLQLQLLHMNLVLNL